MSEPAIKLPVVRQYEPFPEAEPGLTPVGQRLVVQLRSPREQTKGGIYVPETAQDDVKWATQIAKVISTGPMAFCNRNTGKPWPEGAWVKPGDFIRVPRYGLEKWWVKSKSGETSHYAVLDDLNVIGIITVDPKDHDTYFGATA